MVSQLYPRFKSGLSASRVRGRLTEQLGPQENLVRQDVIMMSSLRPEDILKTNLLKSPDNFQRPKDVSMLPGKYLSSLFFLKIEWCEILYILLDIIDQIKQPFFPQRTYSIVVDLVVY